MRMNEVSIIYEKDKDFKFNFFPKNDSSCVLIKINKLL